METGLYDEAIECFQKVVQADAGHARARYNLGRTYLGGGDRALALEQQWRLQELDSGLADQLLTLIEK